jgi:hypothetical protein
VVHPADEPGEKWDEGGRSGRIGAALDALFQSVMSFGRLSAVLTYREQLQQG